MSLKKRIVLSTILGLVVILFFYNLLIYVFFVRISTEGETGMLWNRAQTVLRKPEVRQPGHWGPGLLDEFLMEHSMLRIIDPSGAVRSEAVNDPRLARSRPVYMTRYHTRIVSNGKYRKIYIQVPILTLPSKQQVGALELGRCLDLNKGYLWFLVLTLASGSVIAVLFSILIAYQYVRWIYKPITELAGTMERIVTSGTFRKLDAELLPERDEFGRLGLTFNRMISRLEDNYNRQRRFVMDASHELRTPLTVIRSYAGMLKRWGAQDPKLRDEAVEAIEQESERLHQLVRDLLQLADRREPLSVADFKCFDLLELMRRTAKELSRSLKRKITVQPEQEDGACSIEASPKRLKQLLIILLDNALAYSDKPVVLALQVGEKHVRITVEDQGIGIPREHLRHLFDRFYRADQARSRRSGGSGLGLSIAKEIVTEHRGTITIDSTPGKGTLVTVVLPKKQEGHSQEERADRKH